MQQPEGWYGRVEAVLRLSIPASAAMLSYTFTGLVDTMLVGRLGAVSLGAVGLASMVLLASTSLWLGVLNAVTPLAAQNEGAGRRHGSTSSA